MRKELAKEKGQRKRFSATFGRIGKKSNYHGYAEDTILLKDIIDLETNKIVADHMWFSFTKGFETAGVKEGMQVEFDASVKEYTKGHVDSRYRTSDRKRDYKLSHPTKIKAIKASSKNI